MVLIHLEDGIPSVWTNDKSILVVLHDKDVADSPAWEEYQRNDPYFDKLMVAPGMGECQPLSPTEAWPKW